MQRKRIVTLVVLFCAVGCRLAAQQMVTLQDAIGAALNYNYDILLVRNDSVAAGIDQHYIFGGFLPAVNASVGRTKTVSTQKQVLVDNSERKGDGISF